MTKHQNSLYTPVRRSCVGIRRNDDTVSIVFPVSSAEPPCLGKVVLAFPGDTLELDDKF